MKNKYIHTALILAGAIVFLTGCKNEVIFPDPGFDLVTNKNVSVRRDTADKYDIILNVSAPAGVDVIQILDGRTFDVLEELTQYRGQKQFPFTYEVKLNHLNKERDTVLIYNVRIRGTDNRGFNSSFRINVKKLSTPEIFFSHNNIIGTTVPVVGIRGLVTTGIPKIKSIKVFINEEEKYSVPASELAGLSEYKLETNVSYNFEVGKSYPMRIEIIDDRNKVLNEYLTVIGTKMKKVTGISATRTRSTGTDNYGRSDIFYDDQDRIVKIRHTLAIGNGPMHHRFFYNDKGQIEEMQYSLQSLANIFIFQMEYDEQGRLSYGISGAVGRIHVDGEDWSDDLPNYDTPATSFPYFMIQNFRYRPDGTLESFDINRTTTFPNVQYADGFFPGEKIFAEFHTSYIENINWGARKVRSGFVPVLNPAYVEGMFSFHPRYDQENWFQNLYMHKYIWTEDVRGPNNTEAANTFYSTCTYTTGPDGQLETFSRWQTAAMMITFRYEYAEE